jgi:hypothetical protein
MQSRSLLSLTDTQEALRPFAEQVLVDAHVKAVQRWQRFMRKLPKMAIPMDATARAGMIHCWIKDEVRRTIEGESRIREVTSLGFFAIAVDANPLVRFKYLAAGLPRNVQTEQQEKLSKQLYKEEALEAMQMEGIPGPPTLLTCGYKLTPVGELRKVEVRCDSRSEFHYSWPIYGPEADAGEVIEPIRLTEVPAPTPAAVRSKRKTRKVEEDEGS